MMWNNEWETTSSINVLLVTKKPRLEQEDELKANAEQLNPLAMQPPQPSARPVPL